MAFKFKINDNSLSVKMSVYDGGLTFKVAPAVRQVITLEAIPLEVTANGEYTPADGFVYNRVSVSVPIPSNYGLITYNGSTLTVS